MVEYCGGEELTPFTVRFKLIQLQERSQKENELELDKLRSSIPEIQNLDAQFERSLKSVFLDHLTEWYRYDRNYDDIIAIEYVHKLEFKLYHKHDGFINLRTNENRYKLIQRVFAKLEKKFSMTAQEVICI